MFFDLSEPWPEDEDEEVKMEAPVNPIFKRIENDFTYHRPPAEKVEVFKKLREKARELAFLIVTETPSGREQSSALTRLEEAVFHANAAIARQYPAEK